MGKIISNWPDGKKLAVMVTVMFEIWSEGKAPPYSPMTTSLKPGTPDLLGISWSQYGGKTGIWRFMRIFDDTDIKATICLNAKAAEVFPGSGQGISTNAATRSPAILIRKIWCFRIYPRRKRRK